MDLPCGTPPTAHDNLKCYCPRCSRAHCRKHRIIVFRAHEQDPHQSGSGIVGVVHAHTCEANEAIRFQTETAMMHDCSAQLLEQAYYQITGLLLTDLTLLTSLNAARQECDASFAPAIFPMNQHTCRRLTQVAQRVKDRGLLSSRFTCRKCT